MLVDVLLPLNFDQTFTYKIDQKAEVGNIVLVSFKNKEIIGVIWSLNSESLKKGIKIKKIIKILDLPTFSINKINFIKQMSNYNLIKKGLVFNLFLYKNGLKSFEKGLNKINDFSEFKPKINLNKNLNSEQEDILKNIEKKIDFIGVLLVDSGGWSRQAEWNKYKNDIKVIILDDTKISTNLIRDEIINSNQWIILKD